MRKWWLWGAESYRHAANSRNHCKKKWLPMSAVIDRRGREVGPDCWEDHASIPSSRGNFFGKVDEKTRGGSSGAKEFFSLHCQLDPSFAWWTCMHPLRLSLHSFSLLHSTGIFSESRGRRLEVGFSLTNSSNPTPLLIHSAPLASSNRSRLFLHRPPYISLLSHPFSASFFPLSPNK